MLSCVQWKVTTKSACCPRAAAACTLLCGLAAAAVASAAAAAEVGTKLIGVGANEGDCRGCSSRRGRSGGGVMVWLCLHYVASFIPALLMLLLSLLLLLLLLCVDQLKPV